MQSGDPEPARVIPVVAHRDRRGVLMPLEAGAPLPFAMQRCFTIADVPPGATRAGHRTGCDEFLVALAGGCDAVVGEGAAGVTHRLGAPPRAGLYLREGTLLLLANFAPGTILLVACSSVYSPRSKP